MFQVVQLLLVSSFPLLALLGTLLKPLHSPYIYNICMYTIYIYYIYIQSCICVALTMDPKQLKSTSTPRKMQFNYKNNAKNLHNTSKANVKENTTKRGLVHPLSLPSLPLLPLHPPSCSIRSTFIPVSIGFCSE